MDFREMAEKVFSDNTNMWGDIEGKHELIGSIVSALRAAYNQGFTDGVREQFDESNAFKFLPNLPSEKQSGGTHDD